MSVRILLEIQVKPLDLVVVPHEKTPYSKQGCDQNDHAHHVSRSLLVSGVVHRILMSLWVQQLVLARHLYLIVSYCQSKPYHS